MRREAGAGPPGELSCAALRLCPALRGDCASEALQGRPPFSPLWGLPALSSFGKWSKRPSTNQGAGCSLTSRRESRHWLGAGGRTPPLFFGTFFFPGAYFVWGVPPPPIPSEMN